MRYKLVYIVFFVLYCKKYKQMKNLPKGMYADRDNIAYYDTERGEFYLISWEDGGNNDIPTRHYIPKTDNGLNDPFVS